jgi:hypothetical protein
VSFRVCLGLLCLLGLSACKGRPDDNVRPPEPWTDRPVQNHRFDGGESDPYFRPGEQGGAGEAKAAAQE